MSDKRAVSTDALQTLGTIITEGGRDAIHLAVEPVIAGELLEPGEHIGLKDGKAYNSYMDKMVGIVDPFLERAVKAGEKFWLIVYPRQITSLRHVWSHPDFPEEVIKEPAIQKRYNRQDMSRIWIEQYANGVGISYEVMMDGADDWLATHDGNWGGNRMNFGSLLESQYVPDEFWNHYEVVRNTIVDDNKKGSFFSCSC